MAEVDQEEPSMNAEDNDGAADDDAAETHGITANANVLSHTDLFSAVEESIISCRPLVNFFYHPTTTGTGAAADGGTAAATTTRLQRRSQICSIVKSRSFNKSRARRLFSGLLPLLIKITDEERYLPDEDDEGNIIVDSEADSTQAVLYLRCCAYLVEAYLEGMLARQGKPRQTSRGGSQVGRQIEIIDEAFEVAEMLHELLFPLQQSSQSTTSTNTTSTSAGMMKEVQQTQSAIFTMCEKYWHGNFEDREQLVTQLIPLLLVKSLDENAQKSDVKRLYSIREAINLLDFQDTSIESLKLHLLRTVGNPLFLQSAEGRKFITHLFLVDGTLVGELHSAVKAQIVGAKKSILVAYADIYYNAWKGSVELSEDEQEEVANNDVNTSEEGYHHSIQTSIEENALQDFMSQVIHASVPTTAKSVRVILDKFYIHKKTPAVEAMLHRMYGPLLWRALSSANSRVRSQASVVLADTFPLRDPEAGTEWTEVVVKKSTEALIALMKDDVPNVRVAGCRATAKILSSFWVAVPSKDIRALLNQIIAKHASDASSSAVRVAAVDAITTLLEEDKTHAVLRPLLPSVGNLIHDKTEKVRLAVVNMLLLIKKIRGMKYYHVVPANHLLARLAEEGRGQNNNPRGPVAKGLSNLLSNSFFPTGSKKTMMDIINRTLRLLSDNPNAAVTFYKNASSQLSVNSISKLIAALMKCLCYYIIEEKRVNCEDISNLSLILEDDEPIEVKGGHNNPALIATIAESISILWESIESDLKDVQNENADELLMDVFSGNLLTEVYCHFESKFERYDDNDDECDDDEGMSMNSNKVENVNMANCLRACVAILNCAGKMDESKIEGLRSCIIGELSKASDMSVEQRANANFSPNVALLCAWGKTDEVAECIASSISEYFTTSDSDEPSIDFTPKSDASRKRKQRGKKQADADLGNKLPKLDIDVCLGILGHILKGSYPASLSARDAILESEKAVNTILSALETARNAADRIIKKKSLGDAKSTLVTIRRVGNSIECYGRLLLHKESRKDEFPMKLTPELKHLVSWVDTIVPSLMKLVGNDSKLRDLDLSSIMSVGSPIASPLSGGPTNRNTTRNSSPVVGDIGDASFMSARGSNVFDDTNKFNCARPAAITSMISVLPVLAEFMSLRCVGDGAMSDAMLEWCKLLENSSDTSLRKLLLQLLFHVSTKALANDGDTSLLTEILLKMKTADPSPDEEEIICYSMSLVISLRDERMLKRAISTIVTVMYTIIAEEADDITDIDMPFYDKVGGSMKKVLGIILSEKQSSLLLAQCIDQRKASSVKTFLFKELESHAPKTVALKEILGKWAEDNVTIKGAAPADAFKENIHENRLHPDPATASAAGE